MTDTTHTTRTALTHLTDLTIAGAAAAIRAGHTSPVELTEAYLTAIAERNPSLNAYVTVTGERALAAARQAAADLRSGRDRGPLHGVPVGIKDLVDTAGVTTAGGAAVYA